MREYALQDQLVAAMVGVPISILLAELHNNLRSLACIETPPADLSPTTKADAIIGLDNTNALRRAGLTLLTKEQCHAWRKRHSDVCAFLLAIRDSVASPSPATEPECPTWKAMLKEVAPTQEARKALQKALSALIEQPSPKGVAI